MHVGDKQPALSEDLRFGTIVLSYTDVGKGYAHGRWQESAP